VSIGFIRAEHLKKLDRSKQKAPGEPKASLSIRGTSALSDARTVRG
jgi:hypothetical protein